MEVMYIEGKSVFTPRTHQALSLTVRVGLMPVDARIHQLTSVLQKNVALIHNTLNS